MTNEGIILFYQTDDGKVTVDVRFYELERDATVSKMEIVQKEGTRYD